MFCTKCGKKVIETANFCSNCGFNITKNEIQDTLENTEKATYEYSEIQRCNCGEPKRNIYQNYKFTGKRVCLSCYTKGICPNCRGALRTEKAEQCPHCGSSWRISPPEKNIDLTSDKHKIFLEKKQPKKLKCPKCKSERIRANKKGFSGTKAVGGAILAGGIGVLAGTIGSNKIILTCLSCSNQFKVGEDYEGIKRKQKEEAEAMKNPFFWIISIGLIILFFWALRSCGLL